MKFLTILNLYSESIEIVDNLEYSIKEGLYVLLTTTLGERLMELEYGCDIKAIAFRPLDLNLKTFIGNNISTLEFLLSLSNYFDKNNKWASWNFRNGKNMYLVVQI